ncbi:MAG: hypothetical protein Q9168_004595 [Polycauliona sp. 1 TL-2023]
MALWILAMYTRASTQPLALNTRATEHGQISAATFHYSLAHHTVGRISFQFIDTSSEADLGPGSSQIVSSASEVEVNWETGSKSRSRFEYTRDFVKLRYSENFPLSQDGTTRHWQLAQALPLPRLNKVWLISRADKKDPMNTLLYHMLQIQPGNRLPLEGALSSALGDPRGRRDYHPKSPGAPGFGGATLEFPPSGEAKKDLIINEIGPGPLDGPKVQEEKQREERDAKPTFCQSRRLPLSGFDGGGSEYDDPDQYEPAKGEDLYYTDDDVRVSIL